VTGSDHEPLEAANAAAQMRDATTRLRDQGWMVAPLTSPVVEPADDADVDA
jgi:hypothetical protein